MDKHPIQESWMRLASYVDKTGDPIFQVVFKNSSLVSGRWNWVSDMWYTLEVLFNE